MPPAIKPREPDDELSAYVDAAKAHIQDSIERANLRRDPVGVAMGAFPILLDAMLAIQRQQEPGRQAQVQAELRRAIGGLVRAAATEGRRRAIVRRSLLAAAIVAALTVGWFAHDAMLWRQCATPLDGGIACSMWLREPPRK